MSDLMKGNFLIDCDVSDMGQLDAAFAEIEKRWGKLDFVVHAIGFTNKEALRGKYFDVTLDDFLMTMNISVYSFTAVAKRAAALMSAGGSMLTLSYYGAEKVIPHYNVMGVAKAALDRRFPLYPQMERVECAAAPQCDNRRRRRFRALFSVRSFRWRDR